MSIIVIERLDKRTYGQSDDAAKWTRTFNVHSDPSTETLTASAAQVAAGMPTFGSAHPDDVSMRQTGLPEISQSIGTSNSWEFIYEYVPAGGISLGGGTARRNELGYIEASFDMKLQFVDAWRTSPVIASETSYNTPVRNEDIGGTAIDSAGKPTSVQLITMEIIITEVVFKPDAGRSFNLIGKRNSKPFLGIPRWFVLYMGMRGSIRLGNGRWRVAHRFVADQYAHLRQAVQLDEDRKPKTITSSGDVYGYPVYFVQPFPGFVDFGNPDLGQLF